VAHMIFSLRRCSSSLRPPAQRCGEALASSHPVGVSSSSAVVVDYALPAWTYGSCCENSGNTRAGGVAG